MLRRFLLVLMAFVASYSLTALAGYALSAASDSTSDAKLSILVRTIFNPLIAILVGALVGLLSRDYAVQITLFGLTPWALLLVGPRKPVSFSGWIISLTPIFVLLPMAAVASAFVWRYRHRVAAKPVSTL